MEPISVLVLPMIRSNFSDSGKVTCMTHHHTFHPFRWFPICDDPPTLYTRVHVTLEDSNGNTLGLSLTVRACKALHPRP